MIIVWIDDEILTLELGIKTMELLGHQVLPYRNIHDFMEWLNKASENSVDVFFVDLMMKCDDAHVFDFIKQQYASITEELDTGIPLICAIRIKFPTKPIVVLTIVTNPPLQLFANDKKILYVYKTPTISPAINAAITLLEKQ